MHKEQLPSLVLLGIYNSHTPPPSPQIILPCILRRLIHLPGYHRFPRYALSRFWTRFSRIGVFLGVQNVSSRTLPVMQTSITSSELPVIMTVTARVDYRLWKIDQYRRPSIWPRGDRSYSGGISQFMRWSFLCPSDTRFFFRSSLTFDCDPTESERSPQISREACDNVLCVLG